MKRQLSGAAFGAMAGILDLTPMVIMGLTWNANLSAFYAGCNRVFNSEQQFNNQSSL